MIYELAVMVKPEATEEQLTAVKNTMVETIEASSGTVLIKDDWGILRLAQPIRKGSNRARIIYVMYTANGAVNAELVRKLGIIEVTIRQLIVLLGPDKNQESVVKNYQNLNTAANDNSDGDLEKDRKLLSKKRSCWFSATKTEPDWKNPKSYSWLVNEFGKISPARVTGLRPVYQRMANDAIKRGRCMGLVSFISNHVAFKA
jgi:ribosomal protein S18/ribosomal protein S6